MQGWSTWYLQYFIVQTTTENSSKKVYIQRIKYRDNIKEHDVFTRNSMLCSLYDRGAIHWYSHFRKACDPSSFSTLFVSLQLYIRYFDCVLNNEQCQHDDFHLLSKISPWLFIHRHVVWSIIHPRSLGRLIPNWLNSNSHRNCSNSALFLQACSCWCFLFLCKAETLDHVLDSGQKRIGR